MNIENLKRLDQFRGTTSYHWLSPIFPNFVLSDGARFLAENADCFWLFDVIATHQPEFARDPMLRHIQFWSLEQGYADTETKGSLLIQSFGLRKNQVEASVVCKRDIADAALIRLIHTTDFPFEAFPSNSVSIWVAPSLVSGRWVAVAYLPSEH